MGYFDALLHYSFQTAPDGRRVFSPWGAFGRAYVVGSELDYERLRRRTKTGLIVAFVLVIISMTAIGGLGLPRYLSYVAWAAAAAAMAAWMQYLLRGLASPVERLSRLSGWKSV